MEMAPIGAISMSAPQPCRWPGFTPPHWPAFAPPLTIIDNSRLRCRRAAKLSQNSRISLDMLVRLLQRCKIRACATDGWISLIADQDGRRYEEDQPPSARSTGLYLKKQSILVSVFLLNCYFQALSVHVGIHVMAGHGLTEQIPLPKTAALRSQPLKLVNFFDTLGYDVHLESFRQR
jgi:hypothetical protein